MRAEPLVSVITPTYGRAALLAGALRWFNAQTHPNLEWLIDDDSPEPCLLLARSTDPRIRYFHDPVRRTVGVKRNRLIDAARGEFIAHLDDDDYYAPQYVATMIAMLEADQADFVNLTAWYLMDLRHNFLGFWNLKSIEGIHYECKRESLNLIGLNQDNNEAFRDNHLGFGFTYAYRRSIVEFARFDDANWGEETGFISTIKRRYIATGIEDTSGLVLHLLHTKSSSSCYPQFRLPSFLLPKLFPQMTALLQEINGTNPETF